MPIAKASFRRRELTDFQDLSDEALIIECRHRPINEQAFSAFYYRFRGMIMQRIVCSLPEASQKDAEDLAQEVFVRLYSGLLRYDSKKSKIKTYIKVITDRIIIDYLRHGRLERDATSFVEDQVSSIKMYARDDPILFNYMVEQLAKSVTDPSKLPLVLDLLTGMEVKDIAKKHGVKANQVYSARSRLRELLEADVDPKRF